jgi:hypothetical protein
MKTKNLTYKQKLEIIFSNPTDLEKSFISLHPQVLNWRNYERKTIDEMYEYYLNNLKTTL